MAFSVTYSFNNGAVTGTATDILQLRSAIYNYAHSGSVSDSTGSNYNYLTQCTLSGTAEGQLTSNEQGTSTGTGRGVFYGCRSLASLDLSSFDTSKVTNMNTMFRDCQALTSIDLSSFDTSKVTNMQGMFYGCSGLTSLDLSSFNTSKVTNMSYMFQACSRLTSLDLSSFDTGNATDMSCMFYDCPALTRLNLSSFDTSKVTNMNTMFDNCQALTSIDLSSFDTSKVTNMSYMFENCQLLTSIKVNKLSWNTNLVTSSNNMFNACIRLPNYNSSYKDKTKAIDKSLGGYLDVIIKPIIKGTYKYFEHYSDGVKVIPKSTDMFDFVTQEVYDNITSPDPDMLYFIIE